MSTPNPPGKNRRLSARWPAKGPPEITCQRGTMGLGANLALSILDISESGIRLIVKSTLRVGEELEINLTPAGQGKPFRMLAEVVWVLELPDGKFCIGARFEKYVSYSDLQRLT